jgi:hypothetical protein
MPFRSHFSQLSLALEKSLPPRDRAVPLTQEILNSSLRPFRTAAMRFCIAMIDKVEKRSLLSVTPAT